MMLGEIRAFAKKRAPFAFETTLSGRGYLALLRQLKAEGYEIHIFFLWVKTADLALSRYGSAFRGEGMMSRTDCSPSLRAVGAELPGSVSSTCGSVDAV